MATSWKRSRSATGFFRSGRRILLSLALGIGLLALLGLELAWRGMAASARPQQESSSVCFYVDPLDSLVRCVPRFFPQAAATITDRVSLRLQALVAGPTAEERATGLWSPLPSGARVASFQWSGQVLTLYLELPAAYLERTSGEEPALSPWTVDRAAYLFLRHLEPFGVHNVQVLARNPADGRFYALSWFLREPPPTNKPKELARASGEPLAPMSVAGQPPAYSRPQAQGFLSGKAIYLSAGHGWYWYAPGNRWQTQRVNTNGLVEDLNNAETLNQFLMQYLYNAGADVWPVRERDMNPWEGIADNDNPQAYQEQGAWSPGTLPGYNGGTYRTALTALGAVTAQAVWTLTPPRDGVYAVYAWYTSGSNRSTDAQFLIEHAGGRSEVRVNQQGHGYTWRYLGSFPFRGGQPARVILTNRTERPENLNRVVVADAVRIGGGMGTVTGDGPPSSPGPSGRPRWEEAARYWAKYQGAPPSVYDPFQCSTYSACGDQIDDVTARPRYAEWEREPFDDPVYFSFHTNGYNGTLRGTESYVYDNSDPNYRRTPGSLELQNAIHTQVIQDIRAGWDPNWIDRGKKQANLGELRLLSTMPGVLLEAAFHDNPQDAAALKDPRFAMLVARAVYKGIVRYYAQRDGRSPIFLPEPPQAPLARQTGPGQVTLSWQPSPSDGGVLLGHPATAYKVYTSTDGFAWSDGVLVNSPSYTLSGLPEGTTLFFRVTGLNAGGESFPTPVVGVRVGPWGAPRLLLVDGFDRLDAAMRPTENLGGSLGLVTRMPIARMNGFDALAGVGRALSMPFDGATDEAVSGGFVGLENYPIVLWLLGEEGFSEPTLEDSVRARLRNFLANGGRLILSGSNIGQDLSQRDPGFLADALRVGFVADDAGARTVRPVPGSLLDGIGDLTLDDGTMGSHRVTTPDVLAPGRDAQVLMQYPDGRAAATFFGAPCPQAVVFGFPLESTWPMAARAALLSRLLNAMTACGAPLETAITVPAPNARLNQIPVIEGTGSPSDITGVQVALQRTADQQWWTGSGWGGEPVWLTATGRLSWSWTPPPDLTEGTYGVLARAIRGTTVDPTPAAVTFTLDRTPPGVPMLITPTVTITYTPPIRFEWAPTGSEPPSGYVLFINNARLTVTTPIFLANLVPGEYQWTVAAFDAAGNLSGTPPPVRFYVAPGVRGSMLYLPLILREAGAVSPPPPACEDRLRNGGFEADLAGTWEILNPSAPIARVQSPVYEGQWAVRLGDLQATSASYATLWQRVNLDGRQVTLTLWRLPQIRESRDRFYIGFRNARNEWVPLLVDQANTGTWEAVNLDLTPYSGQIITLTIGVYNNGSGWGSATVIDGVRLEVCR
ncbi:N-acetylmuramoyl-L-alanine amidase [Thermoflexus sp.]|uniref:golvesin C-terminal-like domain-containing protein n=1 Tax=Thermoflexus sp. TaxID=1969742 RepID=UPI00260DD199|nr:N-acetylmuramoyl-L-alanine amidase [Thermoflexus sp.]MCX7690912.1 N-acetylmuramoyl-L-alanine amidase [Thermoflexus sp.]